MQETWKDIPGYEKLYQASNLGRIKSVSRKRKNQYSDKEIILKNVKQNIGYYTVCLYKNKIGKIYLVHRLVILTFVSNTKNKREVNHIDGNKLNNKLENLEWVTSGENRKHAYKIGLKNNFGENHSCHKLCELDVNIIRKLYKNTKYWNQPKLAKLFNVTRENIRCIVNYKSWKYI